MPDINLLSLEIWTANIDNAGTDGDVYLGCGGREFRCETEGENFDTGYHDKFVFGVNANVVKPENNDPSNPQITVDDTEKFPVYIRFSQISQASEWCMERAILTTYFGINEGPKFAWEIGRIWLGRSSGLICYIGGPWFYHPD